MKLGIAGPAPRETTLPPLNRLAWATVSIVQNVSPFTSVRKVEFSNAAVPMSIQLGRPGAGGVKNSVLQFPPYSGAISTTSEVRPRSLRKAAADMPEGPAPNTQTSLWMHLPSEPPVKRAARRKRTASMEDAVAEAVFGLA